MTNALSLAFFLPAYNEADNIMPRVEELKSFEHKAGLSALTIIVVDDGSSDHTPQVLDSLKSDVVAVAHGVNRGYGAALRSGLSAGVESGHEWIAFCDSDGQFNPADVQLLLDMAERESADVVVGYREHRADSFRRRLMGRGWHWLTSGLLGYQARDVDCGFKLFRREAVVHILPRLSGEYAMISPEIITRLQMADFSVAEVAVPHFARQFGMQTGASFGVVVKSLMGIFKLRRMIKDEEMTIDTHVQRSIVQTPAA